MKVIIIAVIILISAPALADAARKCRIGEYQMYRNAFGENFVRITWTCNRDRGYDSIRGNEICGTTDNNKRVCGPWARIYEARSGTVHEVQLGSSQYPLKRAYLIK